MVPHKAHIEPRTQNCVMMMVDEYVDLSGELGDVLRQRISCG